MLESLFVEVLEVYVGFELFCVVCAVLGCVLYWGVGCIGVWAVLGFGLYCGVWAVLGGLGGSRWLCKGGM